VLNTVETPLNRENVAASATERRSLLRVSKSRLAQDVDSCASGVHRGATPLLLPNFLLPKTLLLRASHSFSAFLVLTPSAARISSIAQQLKLHNLLPTQ
jgi:hypothetical protein